jgi:hypothetical protein
MTACALKWDFSRSKSFSFSAEAQGCFFQSTSIHTSCSNGGEAQNPPRYFGTKQESALKKLTGWKI